MNFFYKIYVDKEEIYTGDFDEVPKEFQEEIREALAEWADSLGKRGLNEMVYSLFAWYEKKSMHCGGCNKWHDEGNDCPDCDGKLKETYIYERNKKLDMLLSCVGMISRIEVTQ